MDSITEKFTRCPKCRAFSIRRLGGENKDKKPGFIQGKKTYICDNCSHQFSLGPDKLPEPPVPSFEVVTPQVQKKPNKLIYIIPVSIILVVLGYFIIGRDGSIPADDPVREDSTLKERESLKEPETIKENQTVKKEEIKPDEVDSQLKPAMPVKEVVPQAREVVHEEESVPTNESDTKDRALPSAVKVFDLSHIKIRSSHPDNSDPSFRWAFSRKTVSIERGVEQRVFLAGNDKGTKKWLVDDLLLVNGVKVPGLSEAVTEIGFIPEFKKVPPFEITQMVPANKVITLNLHLVDYGIFWGNTDIYVVVK